METPTLPIFKILSLTLVLSTFLHSSLSESELCNPQDKKVLLQIKKAFNYPYDLASWKPETDCCDWYGVECSDKTHRVWILAFDFLLFEGPIPPQVGDLPFLESLQFERCSGITGPIPSAVAKLGKLRSLTIVGTSISGCIPEFIGGMNSLESISLSHNNLMGEIPSSIGSLERLTELSLDWNKLTGPIPQSFGEFKVNYFYLDLNHNQLSGKIPASLGNVDFYSIDLSQNKLEGDASILFGSKKSTRYLDISRNLFEFDFSNVKFSKKRLFRLDISHNKIYGSLPKGLTELSLRHFNVSYNQLSGQIPQGGDLQKFDAWAYVGNNGLCDPPLPSCNLIMEA